ncbi:hypothetical protein SELMODRAFT_420158 [Selaginella moellendorffii]|uniref:Uncharacterized protein n=1 Tax=Selaginella moellendorffii TaxID=88036 RepID=D8SB53_SELML|nr:hypothetical protein SELMODRAFT_420158 [Selaginella moellendorffii]
MEACNISSGLIWSPGIIAQESRLHRLEKWCALRNSVGGLHAVPCVEAPEHRFCPVKKYGCYWAYHTGAAADRLANIAHSYDEPGFVEVYFRNVLQELHAPDDGVWKDRDLNPFLQWILKHECHWRHLQLSCGALRWIEAAKKMMVEEGAPAKKNLKSLKAQGLEDPLASATGTL